MTKPGRITLLELCRETGTSKDDIPRRLKAAGVSRSPVDKTWSRGSAIKALMAAKSIPHMVAKRASGKVGGNITHEDIDGAFLTADEIIFGTDETPATGNTFAANVSKDYSAMTAAKTASELQRVRKLTLENDKAAGLLISRAAAVATAKDIVVRTRSALLSMGDKIAPMVAGLTDEIEIAAIISAEVRHALGSLANPDAFTREAIA